MFMCVCAPSQVQNQLTDILKNWYEHHTSGQYLSFEHANSLS